MGERGPIKQKKEMVEGGQEGQLMKMKKERRRRGRSEEWR